MITHSSRTGKDVLKRELDVAGVQSGRLDEGQIILACHGQRQPSTTHGEPRDSTTHWPAAWRPRWGPPSDDVDRSCCRPT